MPRTEREKAAERAVTESRAVCTNRSRPPVPAPLREDPRLRRALDQAVDLNFDGGVGVSVSFLMISMARS
jgi:hypothetical protein